MGAQEKVPVAQELGVSKIRQNRNQVVSGKGDLTDQMAM